jgi:hypothetical protein
MANDATRACQTHDTGRGDDDDDEVQYMKDTRNRTLGKGRPCKRGSGLFFVRIGGEESCTDMRGRDRASDHSVRKGQAQEEGGAERTLPGAGGSWGEIRFSVHIYSICPPATAGS